VVHLHFLLWRDKYVPDDIYPLLAFRRKVRSLDAGSTGPLLIHCSAGVGRSGTYMALDMLLDELKRCGEVDVFAVVTHLRNQRMALVQTKVFIYIHLYSFIIVSSLHKHFGLLADLPVNSAFHPSGVGKSRTDLSRWG